MSGQRNPVVFVHGYSDKGASWQLWREVLCEKLGIDDGSMHTCTYVSLDNGVSIKDIAEAFDRALAAESGLDGDQPFDAVVHSTGMLVVRAWLAADPLRAKRLKRLIALAPATFGSPLGQAGAQLARRGVQGQQAARPRFSRSRRPDPARTRTCQRVYLAARRAGFFRQPAALRRRPRHALRLCLLRHRHLQRAAQDRRQTRHRRDGAALGLRHECARDLARHDRDRDGGATAVASTRRGRPIDAGPTGHRRQMAQRVDSGASRRGPAKRARMSIMRRSSATPFPNWSISSSTPLT